MNVGCYIDGKRSATKKALKEALNGDSDRVRFDPTSMFDDQTQFTATEYRDNVNSGKTAASLSVVGPDPYTSRKWYATVYVDRNGKIKVG